MKVVLPLVSGIAGEVLIQLDALVCARVDARTAFVLRRNANIALRGQVNGTNQEE
jgi:hypothetical protein